MPVLRTGHIRIMEMNRRSFIKSLAACAVSAAAFSAGIAGAAFFFLGTKRKNARKEENGR